MKDERKQSMLEALERSLGVVSLAVKGVGITRQTHYNWYKLDEEYRMAVDSVSDIVLDFAESKLYEQIKNDNITAIIFYLKTKGKKRGYIERDYSVLNDENLTNIKIEIVNNE